MHKYTFQVKSAQKFLLYFLEFSLKENLQGKYMDIEFDFKGDPLGGVISNCKLIFFFEISNTF